MRRVGVAASVSMVVALACGVCGCATTGRGTKKVSYSQTAKSNYHKGMEELEDENYPEAVKYFTFVKNKFPFSRYSASAELRIADALYAQEKYTESIDAYKLFINFHPTHKEVVNGYAAYRICSGYVKQIPSDWFLVPPSYEKDQSATRDALRELLGFMRIYPTSKYVPKVKKLYQQSVRRLVAHELYVARFYLDRDKPKAAIFRLEGVLKNYPDAGVHPEVMLLLGQTYLKLQRNAEARRTFSMLVKKYPGDANSAKAKLYLKHLGEQ